MIGETDAMIVTTEIAAKTAAMITATTEIAVTSATFYLHL
jgi:hypothetical protein